ncbi:adenine phosphoribosyltransferase [Christiangramia forsetii]|uniref:Adenine phosphoribosyltransferase n=2 Tax=Christiangramia forsetii TaxID=411153 RepID=APT_CHRFK|nr:adenine phosphoribosyltransferase [Christiangramia forsetii]A0LYK2.1 RecName: Full=Adenine phosphoribosyltransferase; Short=APRT [Christiangramia forsetii KT0803]GGG33991.1 adenine phosphoribosyltransferase [Christiangramia forsetii]CAL65447.1 adenine phosphoribosyl transferase [Christiangramia forsetii KT0803]
MELKSYVREIADFPKKGVSYKDITPLLLDPEAMRLAVKLFMKNLPHGKIDKVVGIESRGFFFATMLAEKLNAGFIPVRKPGKLPHRTHKENYDLEYGSDSLEIHEDAIKKGEKVLLHDDVLATGGTAAATCKLIEKCGGEIVQCNFLVELEFLKGVDKLKGYDVCSLIKYS